MNKVIAIVGMPGAGKSEASNFFTDKGFERVYFGSAIIEGLEEEGLSRNAENETYYRKKIRDELGMAAVAMKVLPKIKKAIEEKKLIILDGLYGWEEYVYLQKEIQDLVLLCIFASPDIRYERLAIRKERTFTRSEAKERDINEIEVTNKGGPIAIADHLIKNEGTKEEFTKELELFLDNLQNDSL